MVRLTVSEHLVLLSREREHERDNEGEMPIKICLLLIQLRLLGLQTAVKPRVYVINHFFLSSGLAEPFSILNQVSVTFLRKKV